MSTEIERAIDDLIREAKSVGAVESSIWAGLEDIPGARLVAARARLLALLAPEPEPSDAEIEAAAKEIALQLNVEDDWGYWLDGANAVLLAAARAARQTGGA